MKKLILLTMISLMVSTVHSQWISISSPTNEQLLNITFTSHDTGFISGRSYILKTTNAGITWEIVHSVSFPVHITDINFPEPLIGYAVGDNMFFKTVDGGNNWTESWTPSSSTFRGVYFMNADTGFICGQAEEIWRTNDGGISWFPQNQGLYWLRGFSFPLPGIGYCTGDGETVYKTVDNGQSWTFKHGGGTNNFTDLSFINSDTGFVCGHAGYVGKTTNGGISFQQITVPVTVDFEGIWVMDEQNIYVVGLNGTILKTGNGGATWEVQITGATSFLRKMYFYDSGNGFIVGHDGTILTNVTAIEDKKETEMFTVSPVPAKDKLTIRSTSDHIITKIDIFDIQGNKVLSEANTSALVTLGLDLVPGLYMLVLSADDGTVCTRKVIVE